MDSMGKNVYDEFYEEFDKYYGCKVEPGGVMTCKQFCDIMINDVASASYIIPIDFNDVRAVFKYVRVADAAVFTCQITDCIATIKDIVSCFQKHHPQAGIRDLMFLFCISEDADLSIGKFYEFLGNIAEELKKHGEEINFVWGIARDNGVKPGQMRIISGAGLYYDVKNDDVRTKLSRKLAYMLRHTDAVDRQGFCSVSDALEYCGIIYEELRYIVDNDNKNRFEVVGESVVEACIRARNGHSGKVKIDPGLKLATPPMILYHGTTEKALENILGKEEGLKGMTRQYVQLTDDPKIALDAAKRHKKYSPVLLGIHAYNALCCGIHFYRATNGVWQVEHVPYYFIHRVDDSHENECSLHG